MVYLVSMEMWIFCYIANEWKTRYESQTEMNNQLERQILRLQDKIDEHSRTLSDSESYYHIFCDQAVILFELFYIYYLIFSLKK